MNSYSIQSHDEVFDNNNKSWYFGNNEQQWKKEQKHIAYQRFYFFQCNVVQ